MIRGITTFKCHECGKRFKAPDMELNGTVLSVPQPCPVCGSRHSYPAINVLSGPRLYRDVWKKLDSE